MADHGRSVEADGPRAREQRLAAGIPLERVARALGADLVATVDMEAGLKQPTRQQAVAWAKVLGWPPERLIVEGSRPYRPLDLDRPVPGSVR